MYTFDSILHNTNWSALALAILYKRPLTVERALDFACTGKLPEHDFSTECREIENLRGLGISWRQIGEMLFLPSPCTRYMRWICKLNKEDRLLN